MLQRPQSTHRRCLDWMALASRRELWMPNSVARRIVGLWVTPATVAVFQDSN